MSSGNMVQNYRSHINTDTSKSISFTSKIGCTKIHIL